MKPVIFLIGVPIVLSLVIALFLLIPEGTDAEPGTPAARGHQVFQRQGCATCHRRFLEYPLQNLEIELGNRLHDPEYLSGWEIFREKAPAHFQKFETGYNEVREAKGVDRVKVWMRNHIRDPAFDYPLGEPDGPKRLKKWARGANPDRFPAPRMPKHEPKRLSDDDLADLIEYLLTRKDD